MLCDLAAIFVFSLHLLHQPYTIFKSYRKQLFNSPIIHSLTIFTATVFLCALCCNSFFRGGLNQPSCFLCSLQSPPSFFFILFSIFLFSFTAILQASCFSQPASLNPSCRCSSSLIFFCFLSSCFHSPPFRKLPVSHNHHPLTHPVVVVLYISFGLYIFLLSLTAILETSCFLYSLRPPFLFSFTFFCFMSSYFHSPPFCKLPVSQAPFSHRFCFLLFFLFSIFLFSLSHHHFASFLFSLTTIIP